jgi:hypothetical protein
MLAFEVLLSEMRRQVQRKRGDPAPVRIPFPRVLRWVLAPWSTFAEWRRLVLELTALRPSVTTAVSPRSEAVPPEEHMRIGDALAVSENGVSGEQRSTTDILAVTPVSRPDFSHREVPATADTLEHNSPDPDLRVDPPAKRASAGDERVRQLVQLLNAGEEPTGEQVGTQFGCSARTGQRLIERAREVLEVHQLQAVGEG